MARAFTDGTPGSYVSKTLSASLAMPISFSFWANVTTFNGRNLLGVSDSTGANYYAVVQFNATNPGALCLETCVSSSAVDDAASANFNAGTWVHVAAVWTSGTARALYINGVKTTATASKSPTGTITTATIGGAKSGATVYTAACLQAFAAIWNGLALSDSDVTELSKGLHPSIKRADKLVVCCDVSGAFSPEPDRVSSGTWALTNTATQSVNPAIYIP